MKSLSGLIALLTSPGTRALWVLNYATFTLSREVMQKVGRNSPCVWTQDAITRWQSPTSCNVGESHNHYELLALPICRAGRVPSPQLRVGGPSVWWPLVGCQPVGLQGKSHTQLTFVSLFLTFVTFGFEPTSAQEYHSGFGAKLCGLKPNFYKVLSRNPIWSSPTGSKPKT